MQTQPDDPISQAKIIAAQNDRFRQTFGADFSLPGRVVITRGVQARGAGFLQKLMAAVQAFDRFEASNDPYGQRDFGEVEIDGVRVWFKLDLFDRAFRYGSENPADPAVTRRVMTLLLPDEY